MGRGEVEVHKDAKKDKTNEAVFLKLIEHSSRLEKGKHNREGGLDPRSL